MRTVISASRRTDIPGFYMRWLENRIRQGGVEVRNPVMKDRTYHVSLRPEDVHTIVLWSKNFRPFLDSPLSRDQRFRWHFNFSLVDCPEWERGAPPLDERLRQAREIAGRWSPHHINWRFDPIVFWEGGRRNNVESFQPICDVMGELGVSRCTVSFVSWYNKVTKREIVRELDYYDPPLTQKLDILSRLSDIARERGMTLASCSNDALLAAEGVEKGRCIDGRLLSELAGERCSLARDGSQRSDCGCTKSSDIGGYQMSCPHNCLYCYAKPVKPPKPLD
ncbi:MAG: DUF1848 family protein [Candidatus Omnitrophica bacterium]|nr:DUF1848 family protein [Candidatus Omnitrophota bacterium]